MYVPNPSCRDFAKYEWIGQLMGAALRGKEFLVLALPGFVWKQLSGEEVSWSKDFPAVDSVLVSGQTHCFLYRCLPSPIHSHTGAANS